MVARNKVNQLNKLESVVMFMNLKRMLVREIMDYHSNLWTYQVKTYIKRRVSIAKTLHRDMKGYLQLMTSPITTGTTTWSKQIRRTPQRTGSLI